MLKQLVIFFLFSFLPFGESQAQIKDKFIDKNDQNRTIVIKENTADDYKILEEQFGDAKVGEVIRITTTKAKVPKERKITPKRSAPKRTVPKKVKVDKPKPQPQAKPIMTKKKIKRPDGPSGIPGTYPIKERPKKKRVRIKSKKKFKGSKSGACYEF